MSQLEYCVFCLGKYASITCSNFQGSLYSSILNESPYLKEPDIHVLSKSMYFGTKVLSLHTRESLAEIFISNDFELSLVNFQFLKVNFPWEIMNTAIPITNIGKN